MTEHGLIEERQGAQLLVPVKRHGRGFRSIWISDLHLGTRRCRARELLEFLDQHQAENLYLVGDIVDGWVSGPRWHWDRDQGAVAQKIVASQRGGVRIVFLPGNHDEMSVDLAQALFGPLPVASELIHRTAQGHRMLVTHGHQFDGALNPNRIMHLLGTQAYHQALRVDQWYSAAPAVRFSDENRSSSYFKRRLEKAIRYVTDFGDRVVVQTARRHRVDGIICGHTHLPQRRSIGPISYINDGDWVKNCTALVEDYEGNLRLLYRDSGRGAWSEMPAAPAEAAS